MFSLIRKAANTLQILRDLAQHSGSFDEWLGVSDGTRSFSPRTALEVGAVFCAVRVIAEGVAQMPVRIQKIERKGSVSRRVEQLDHQALRLLTQKPNDWMSAYEFREFMVFIAALCGDFVAIKNTLSGGKVQELLPLPPGTWTVTQRSDYGLVYQVHYADKTHDLFTQKQVFHLRGPSLDGFSGLKPLHLARAALGLTSALEKHQSQLAQHGGRPSGVLSTEAAINDEQRTKLRTQWNERFGAGGLGGVAVLDLGWKFSAMSMTSVDAQHLETRRLQIEEIGRAFRVFPQMLMSSDKTSTFASAESFFRAHVTHTLGPWVHRLESVVMRDLISEPAHICDIDQTVMLRGDMRDEAAYVATMLGAGGTPGVLTQNEVRARIGYDASPDPSADKLPEPSYGKLPAAKESTNA